MEWELLGHEGFDDWRSYFAKSEARNWVEATCDLSEFWLKLGDIIRDEPSRRREVPPWNCIIISMDIANFNIRGQIAMREDWPKDMWRTSGRISMYFIEERMVELGKPEEGPAEGLEALEQWSQQAFPAMVRVIEETKIAMRDAITAEVRAMLGAIREVHPFAIYLIEGEDERTIERVELAGVASES